MKFNISLGSEAVNRNGESVLEGSIFLCGSIESFYAPDSFWKREQYLKSWRDSFSEGYASKSHSALIVSMRDPLLMNFMFAWILYFEGEKVFVQNKVLFMDDVRGAFEVERINDYFGDRETFNEDGVKISEWEFALEEVVGFFEEGL